MLQMSLTLQSEALEDQIILETHQGSTPDNTFKTQMTVLFLTSGLLHNGYSWQEGQVHTSWIPKGTSSGGCNPYPKPEWTRGTLAGDQHGVSTLLTRQWEDEQKQMTYYSWLCSLAPVEKRKEVITAVKEWQFTSQAPHASLGSFSRIKCTQPPTPTSGRSWGREPYSPHTSLLPIQGETGWQWVQWLAKQKGHFLNN